MKDKPDRRAAPKGPTTSGPHAARPAPALSSQDQFRLKVLLPPLLLLCSFIAALVTVGTGWVQRLTEESARVGATSAAQALQQSAELQLALQKGDSEREKQVLLRTLDGDPALAYLALRHVGAAAEKGGQELLVLRAHDDSSERLRPQAAALAQMHDAIHDSALRSAAGIDLMVVRKTLVSGERPTDLFIGVSLAQKGADFRGGLFTLVLLSGIFVVSYLLLMLFLFGGFSRRMAQLAVGVRAIERGDLRVRLGTVAPSELGDIGHALDSATDRIGRVVGRARTLLALLDRTASDIGAAAEALRRGVTTQSGDADDALTGARELGQLFAQMVARAEQVREETRLSGAVTARLASLGQEAGARAEEAERLTAFVSEGLAGLTGFVADGARQVATMADTGAAAGAAMGEVRQGGQRIREQVAAAQAQAEQAGRDAERGAAALQEGLSGLSQVQAVSRSISAATDHLQERVAEIGDVLHLITELAQRTNLLALNASIIAAQAGTEGRGFAVVADEIKDLARRTAASAGSIDSLIGALADGAEAARRAAARGGEAVDLGMMRTREAAHAVADVLSRLRSWAQLARQITTQSDEQARMAQHVGRALQEVQAQATDLHGRAAEQARRGEHGGRQAARLREVAEELSLLSGESGEGAGQAADTLARLLRTVEEMSGDERSRMAEGERVRGLLEMLRRASYGQRDVLVALDRAAADLRAQAQTLSEELAGLRY